MYSYIQEDLLVLQVTNPFHQVSLKRAIQGLRYDLLYCHQCNNHTTIHRLASYRKNYLKTWSSVKVSFICILDLVSCNASQGANQVLLWPASRVSDWLKRIDLGDYTGHLEGSGLHGALMVSHTHLKNNTPNTLTGLGGHVHRGKLSKITGNSARESISPQALVKTISGHSWTGGSTE